MDIERLNKINDFKFTEDKVGILNSLEYTSFNYDNGLFVMGVDYIDEFEEINGLLDFLENNSLIDTSETPYYCNAYGFMTKEETDKAISEIIDMLKEGEYYNDNEFKEAIYEIESEIDNYPLKR